MKKVNYPIMYRLLAFLFLTQFFLFSCNQEGKVRDIDVSSSTYPFELRYLEGNHLIVAEIESAELYEHFTPIFNQFGYTGNGYSWEGHIIQILEKENRELLNKLDFDSEAGTFYVFVDSDATKKEFVNTLVPIFANDRKLKKYLKKANRERVDD